MSRLENQKALIDETGWDCLIILDACRYDYFEKSYEKYFGGNLQKVWASGSNTFEWLRAVFGEEEYDDIVYVSANPIINSQGITGREGYEDIYSFGRVLNVWDEGWLENSWTVPPNRVGKATRRARAEYPGKRLISHFIQPHYPYFSLKQWEKSFLDVLRGFVGREILERIVGGERLNKVRGDIGLYHQENVVEITAKNYGDETLKRAYEKNLGIVLQEVAKLIDRLPGKIIVSSDHGELLGEDGFYGHPEPDGNRTFKNHPLLREVPWLEVDADG